MAKNFIDLFCGAGGMAKGFEIAGFNQLCGMDWFKEAAMTYKHNFSHPLIEGDITNPEVKSEFINTIKKLQPSVSYKELQKYERMRDKFEDKKGGEEENNKPPIGF